MLYFLRTLLALILIVPSYAFWVVAFIAWGFFFFIGSVAGVGYLLGALMFWDKEMLKEAGEAFGMVTMLPFFPLIFWGAYIIDPKLVKEMI